MSDLIDDYAKSGFIKQPNLNFQIGYEEGDLCNRDGCRGIMGYNPVENCSCHINPPCSHCVENPCVCLECGEEVSDE